MAWAPVVDLTGPAGDPAFLNGIVDVTAAGAAGDGVTDDTAAIQAAIDGSATGAVVWFPPGTYLVSASLRLSPYRAYVGAGGRAQLSRIEAAAGHTGGAVLAARGWWDNATLCDNPIRVEGLLLNAAGVPGLHGMVVYNFWSHIEDVQVSNVDGPDAVGILATDRASNGTTITTNSHSENTFVRCRFYDFTDRATGFKAESNNGESNQDGHLLDGFYASIDGHAVRITRAAGWSIENNHFYGIGYNAISLDNCYATKVMRNYVEDFGRADGANNGAAPTYGYFSGIAMNTVLDTRASIISENTVSVLQPSDPAGNRWTCFAARAGWGQFLANVVLVGNTAVFASNSAPNTSRSWAYRLGEGEDPVQGETPARMLNVEWSGNQTQDVTWWQGTREVFDNTVTVTEDGVRVLRRRMTANWTVPLPAAGARVRIEAQASGAARTVTIPASVRTSTGITERSYPVPSGQVFYGLLEWSSLAGAYVLAAATVSG